MNNIGLIIAREYLSRVRKKSFIIMTLLAPILFGGFIFIVGWTASKGSDTKNIQVVDESGMFAEIFVDSDKDKFDYSDSPLDDAKAKVLTGEYDGLLYIPKLDVDDPQGVMYYAPNNPSIGMVSGLSNKIEGEIENIKLRRSGLDKAVLESL